jgi:hypothetical protein
LRPLAIFDHVQLHEAILQAAVQELGVKEDPPGSNRGERVDEYIKALNLDPATKPPWCGCFVGWCLWEAVKVAGGPPQFQPHPHCGTALKKNKALVIADPEPGCVFIHLNADGTGHTGLVEVVHDDGSLGTVEGNTDAKGGRTGGQVMRQTRARSYVTAFIRIA